MYKPIRQVRGWPELLMPAGNLEKLMTAFAYGADACYIGMPDFSLRYRENQTGKLDLKKAINYAHKLGKKVYVTLNTYPHNVSIKKIISHIKYLRSIKPDAIIFSDPGVYRLIKKYYPKAILHLSVQATCTNFETVRFWRDLGVKRIILARELSLREIAEIHHEVPEIELECFVHGAICMAYSGRCLLSNYMTGRDSNQGDCSHPCRWNYEIKSKQRCHSEPFEHTQDKLREESHLNSRSLPRRQAGFAKTQDDNKKYFLEEALRPGEYFPIFENQHGSHIMSSRDLCLIKYLDKLSRAGIVSFKVEGRAKNTSYVATIARAYRKAIDDLCTGKKFDRELLKEVASVSNRGFFTGFYFGKPTPIDHQLDANRTEGTHDFIGVIRDYDKLSKLATVEIKGQLKIGDWIEVVTPKNIVKLKVLKLYDHRLKPIDIYHPGLTKPAIIKIDRSVEIGDILRKKRTY